MTERDDTDPVPYREPRGVGESLDGVAADVPALDDPRDEAPAESVDHDPSPLRAQPQPAVLEQVVTVVPVEPDPADPTRVIIRRAPRYRAFLGSGAAVGAVLGVVLTAAFPDHGSFSTGAVMAYLVVALALLGALIGGAVAVLVERRRD